MLRQLCRLSSHCGSRFRAGLNRRNSGISTFVPDRRKGRSLKYCFGVSPAWCNVVNTTKVRSMKTKKGDGKNMKGKAESAAAVRASISFPPDVYETLETIAKEKKVSLAWVVREAAERYISEKWPLFARS